MSQYVTSSIGQHFRHIVDLYLALRNAATEDVCNVTTIDYDQRRRGASIETCKVTAVDELLQVKQWLKGMLNFF